MSAHSLYCEGGAKSSISFLDILVTREVREESDIMNTTLSTGVYKNPLTPTGNFTSCHIISNIKNLLTFSFLKKNISPVVDYSTYPLPYVLTNFQQKLMISLLTKLKPTQNCRHMTNLVTTKVMFLRILLLLSFIIVQ